MLRNQRVTHSHTACDCGHESKINARLSGPLLANLVRDENDTVTTVTVHNQRWKHPWAQNVRRIIKMRQWFSLVWPNVSFYWNIHQTRETDKESRETSRLMTEHGGSWLRVKGQFRTLHHTFSNWAPNNIRPLIILYKGLCISGKRGERKMLMTWIPTSN